MFTFWVLFNITNLSTILKFLESLINYYRSTPSYIFTIHYRPLKPTPCSDKINFWDESWISNITKGKKATADLYHFLEGALGALGYFLSLSLQV